MKTQLEPKLYMAIHVSNFEEVCKYLKDKGFELEETVIKKRVKAVCLNGSDPLGNKVDLIHI